MVLEYRQADLTRADGATTTFERFTQVPGTNAPVRESIPVPAPRT
jgi:hypothetical protein